MLDGRDIHQQAGKSWILMTLMVCAVVWLNDGHESLFKSLSALDMTEALNLIPLSGTVQKILAFFQQKFTVSLLM